MKNKVGNSVQLKQRVRKQKLLITADRMYEILERYNFGL